MFFVVKRATLLIPSGPASDPDKKHLFICLTDTFGANKEVLLVPVSTYKLGLSADDACRLFARDHPFIKHDSVIDYRHARIIEASKLVEGVRRGLFNAMDPLDAEVLARVCGGIEKSAFIAQKHLAFFQQATAEK